MEIYQYTYNRLPEEHNKKMIWTILLTMVNWLTKYGVKESSTPKK